MGEGIVDTTHTPQVHNKIEKIEEIRKSIIRERLQPCIAGNIFYSGCASEVSRAETLKRGEPEMGGECHRKLKFPITKYGPEDPA